MTKTCFMWLSFAWACSKLSMERECCTWNIFVYVIFEQCNKWTSFMWSFLHTSGTGSLCLLWIYKPSSKNAGTPYLIHDRTETTRQPFYHVMKNMSSCWIWWQRNMSEKFLFIPSFFGIGVVNSAPPLADREAAKKHSFQLSTKWVSPTAQCITITCVCVWMCVCKTRAVPQFHTVEPI